MSGKSFASTGDLGPKKVSFDELGRGLYAYTAEGDPNSGIIVGDDGCMVIDTQATPAMAQDVIARVRAVTDKPIKYVVLSHYHAVRVFGASAYEGATILASDATRALIAERGLAYDAPGRPKDFGIRTLSTLDLDRQVGSDGATWLDRELVAKDHLPLAGTGFGQEVNAALDRRAARLVEMGHASVKDGFISIPRRTIAALERQEIDRVGKEMAAERGLTYSPSGPGEYVSGRLAGVANLASRRFAMIEDGLAASSCPGSPLWKSVSTNISAASVAMMAPSSGALAASGRLGWGYESP